MTPRYVDVAVAAPVDQLFVYQVPEHLYGLCSVGSLLEVPFGKSVKRGLTISHSEQPDLGCVQIKPVQRIVEPQPLFQPAMVRTLLWASQYYLVPPGEMVFAALPPKMKKKGATSGEKQIRMARLVRDVDAGWIENLERRAPLQAKIVHLLLEKGCVRTADLAVVGSGASGALKNLQMQGLLDIYSSVCARRPILSKLGETEEIHALTAGQQRAVDAVSNALQLRKYAAFLLHGVTGSGKTEVYLQAIQKTLEHGRGAILLVPEISLTPQLASRVMACFGDQVAVLHSGLSEGERLDEWRRLQSGCARVAVGARSAVFAPIASLGLLVVDEEHDGSYKQSERIGYNARDLAMVRAREEQAVVLMGSATPSVEGFSHARSERSTLLCLGERIFNRPLPRIEVVDLKHTLLDPIEKSQTLSQDMAERLAETLDKGRQAILFLNRRGYSSYALCKDCGQSVKCSNCSVSLVHHLKDNCLRCHYCGMSIPVPNRCISCGGGRVRMFGLGTEKCEMEVARRFPGARILRMDSDTTGRKGSLSRIVEEFSAGKADVLIGTQMVTKGHDIPGVTMVGVLLADLSLHMPDFRSAERTFQLIVQVAGRAGRGIFPGRVVIQTFLPENETIELACGQNYMEFFVREIERRRKLGYPPFRRLLLIRVSHKDDATVRQLAFNVAALVRSVIQSDGLILGPVVSPVARIRGRYRWQMMVKSSSVSQVRAIYRCVQMQLVLPKGAKLQFDVDPLDML